MDESTQIKYNKVRETAELIRKEKQNVQGILDEFISSMSDSTNTEVFNGDAAEALTEQFSGLKKKFDEYVIAVEDFASMITYAGESTQQAEAQIREAASELGH